MISCVIFKDTSGIKLTCNGANCIHSEVSQPAWCSEVWVRYSIPQAIDKKQVAGIEGIFLIISFQQPG